MLDLSGVAARTCAAIVSDLEEWTIRTLARFNVAAERRAGRVGVWVGRFDKPALPDGSPRDDKIAAIGVRIRHWVIAGAGEDSLLVSHDDGKSFVEIEHPYKGANREFSCLCVRGGAVYATSGFQHLLRIT